MRFGSKIIKIGGLKGGKENLTAYSYFNSRAVRQFY